MEKEAGRHDAAAVWLTRGLKLDSQSGVFRFHLGELDYHRGMLAPARAHLEEAIRLLPEFADAHHLLAFVLGDLGQPEAAAAAAQRANELNPALSRAETNLSLDRYNPARYGELVGERDARPEAVQSAYLAGYHLGIAYRQRGLYDEALRELGRALDRGEDDGLVRQAIAEVRLVRGEVEEAARLYRELTERSPGSPKLRNELGVALHRGGEVAAAERAYRAAVEADPTYAVAWNNLAVARMHRGDAGAAGECLARAVELHPRLVEAWCNLGLLAERSGKLAPALRSYRAASDADGEATAAWVGAGRVLSEMERFAEARNSLVRAVEIDPESAAARYHLGFVLARLGDFDAARRETIEAGQRAEGEVVVEMEYAPQPRTITYEIGVRNEETGEMEAVQVTNDSLMTRPVVLRSRPLPYAYILPRDAVDAVALLRRNNITVETLTRAVELDVQSYVIEGVQFERAYNHSAAVRLDVAADAIDRTVEFPAGSYVVRTGQMRGRLIGHMLEVETNDNVVY